MYYYILKDASFSFAQKSFARKVCFIIAPIAFNGGSSTYSITIRHNVCILGSIRYYNYMKHLKGYLV